MSNWEQDEHRHQQEAGRQAQVIQRQPEQDAFHAAQAQRLQSEIWRMEDRLRDAFERLDWDAEEDVLAEIDRLNAELHHHQGH